jgi:hypothetical protein
MFLYSTVSTLKPVMGSIGSELWHSGHGGQQGQRSPMVGMVVTISPSLSLYRMVVLPAASSPTYEPQEASGRLPWGPESPLHELSYCSGIVVGTPHHQNAHLLFGDQLSKQLADCETHADRLG